MQQTFIDTISGRRTGIAAACARSALAMCASAYGWGVRVRNRRFDKPHRAAALPVPVISVGNLTTGGTGKTPLVAWIARHLQSQGRRPGILSRGYRSLDGLANDEKRLLDRLCPGVPHVQNPHRLAGGRQLIEQHNCSVVILDDGFQHRRLHRDMDLVLIDALNPWGYGHLLPRGLLREPPAALARAALVLITRADLRDEHELARLEREIAACTPAPILRVSFPPGWLVNADGHRQPLERLRGAHVLAFCGIGNPRGFERTLATLDPRLLAAGLTEFPDHHHYSPDDLRRLGERARTIGATLLVTTEKDLVKLPHSIDGLPVLAVRTDVHFADGGARLSAALRAVIGARG